MERRALAQCLRWRPTTTLYKTQLLPGRIGLRFSSSNNNNSNTTPPPSAPTQTATPSRTPQQPQNSASATDFDQILNTLNLDSTSSTTSSANERSPGNGAFHNDDLSISRNVRASAETKNMRSAVRRADLKLGPTLGRQVAIEPVKGMDLPAALRTLTAVLNQNRVRATLVAQRFHVRKGQLRKEAKSRRWRKLFRYSFGATVKRIQKIRAQGW